MGDVEDMIGTLEEDEEASEDEETDEEKKNKEEREDTFGLDLDSAWGSPDRSAED